MKSSDDWEDRKIHKNGDMPYVSIPHWWLKSVDMNTPIEDIWNARFIFEKKDGKRTVRVVFPGEG